MSAHTASSCRGFPRMPLRLSNLSVESNYAVHTVIESGVHVAPSADHTVGANQPDDKVLLTERQRRILDFERDWTHRDGPKEDAVREEFGLSTTRYYQVLNSMIDSPAALSYDPMLVRRLQRVRDARMGARITIHTEPAN